jgi:hypothetical protein
MLPRLTFLIQEHGIALMKILINSVRKVWSAVVGRNASAEASTRVGVVLHDPGSQRPHDLDDPFFDNKVQERIADVISSAAQKKPVSGP